MLRRLSFLSLLVGNFIFIFTLFSLPAFASDASPYKVGETIYYNIQKLGLKAGQATLVFKGPWEFQRKKTLLVLFTSKGFHFYDQEKIYLDPKTFKPLFVARDLNIFGKREKILETYSADKVTIDKDAGGKKTKEVIQKPGVDNIYGFIYRYRKEGSFKEGDNLDLHLPTKDINVKLVKREDIDAGGKTYDSFYMESDPAQYKVWFDTGSHKLPLKIQGAVGLASTVMVMKDYKE